MKKQREQGSCHCKIELFKINFDLLTLTDLHHLVVKIVVSIDVVIFRLVI